jgi:hypothetical protein
MPLPHYGGNCCSTKWEPIYLNLFEVKIFIDGHCHHLNEQIKAIDEDKIVFNVNETENGVEPLDFIMDCINNNKKGNAQIEVFSKEGHSVCYMLLKGFRFKKVRGLLNFSYANSDKIMEISVDYEHDEMKYLPASKYKIYARKEKLKNLV